MQLLVLLLEVCPHAVYNALSFVSLRSHSSPLSCFSRNEEPEKPKPKKEKPKPKLPEVPRCHLHNKFNKTCRFCKKWKQAQKEAEEILARAEEEDEEEDQANTTSSRRKIIH